MSFRFQIKTKRIGKAHLTEKYINFQCAMKIINSCQNNGIIILGIERFIRKSDGIMPDIYGIADFSDATAEESFEAAKNFMSEYGIENEELFSLTIE